MRVPTSPMGAIKALPNKEAVGFLAALSDSVYQLDHSAGMALVDDAIPAAEALLRERQFGNRDRIHLHWVLGSLWGHRYHLIIRMNPEYAWGWESEEHRKELASLRSAVAQPGFSGLDPATRCSILTDLGSSLNHVGRPIDAIGCWEEALAVDPDFAMAQGNLGKGLSNYGAYLYDCGHTALFLQFASAWLEKALAGQLDEEARADFQATRDEITALLPQGDALKPMDLNAFLLGRSKAERAYRQWCLKERLFLNPLNDVGRHTVAARDVLHCPPILKQLSEEMVPWEHKLINQLKQEFVSARFMLHDALQSASCHFSDRGNIIIDTLDYASNSLRTERTKAALRMAYSLLDKVAWFLDEYFIREPGGTDKSVRKHVYFRSVWHQKNALKPAFSEKKNWPLRGLYSLRNDFFDPENILYLPPDIALMNTLRNEIEHNFFVVLYSDFVGSGMPGSDRGGAREYVVTSDELEAAALRMLKTARSSIVYLLLAINTEERNKESTNNRRVVQMTPLLWKDRWKH